MNNITLLFGLVSIALLFTKYFQPIQPIKNRILSPIITYFTRKMWFTLVNVVSVFTCPKCCSFWLTLIVMGDVLYASMAGVLGMILDLTITKLQDSKLI